MATSAPTQASVLKSPAQGPEASRGQAFKLCWDPVSGCVQVVLPSKTRINFSRDSSAMLWAFCNTATLVHAQDPEFLRVPLTQKQIDEMRKEWVKTNVITMKPLSVPTDSKELAAILTKAMEGLKL